MRAVNLLPSQITERPALLKALPFVGAAAVPVLALALLFIGYTGANSDVSSKSAQLALLQVQVAKLRPTVVAAPSPSAAGLVAQRMQRRAALDSVLLNEVSWDETLRDIARVMPANAWLSSLLATSPTPADGTVTAATAAGANPTSFTINGFALNESDVGLLLARLQLLPTLSNLTLASTSSTLIGTKNIVQFVVTAAFQPAHPAAQTPAPQTPAVKP